MFAVFLAKWCHVAQGLIDSKPSFIQIVVVDLQARLLSCTETSKQQVRVYRLVLPIRFVLVEKAESNHRRLPSSPH